MTSISLRLVSLTTLILLASCRSPTREISGPGLPAPFFQPGARQVAQMLPPSPLTAPGPGPADRLFADLPRWVVPPGGIRRPWQYIVIHHSATPSGSAQRFHLGHLSRGWENGLGYNFVIGNGSDTPDGYIEVGPRWLRQIQGAHCKTEDNRYNERGIGICLVGNFEDDPPSAAQVEALTRLVQFLMEICDIEISAVLTHGGVTHRTACPGRSFSLASFKDRL